jgi:hypothetical protein
MSENVKRKENAMKKRLFFICSTFLFSYYSTKTEVYRPVMTDEQKEEEVEQALKESFGQVIANMITAAMHPESAPQCLANMVQSFLHLVFTTTKNKNVSEDALIEEMFTEACKHVDVEKIRAIIIAVTKLLHKLQMMHE